MFLLLFCFVFCFAVVCLFCFSFWLLHVAELSHEYEYSAFAKSGAVGGKPVAQCMTSAWRQYDYREFKNGYVKIVVMIMAAVVAVWMGIMRGRLENARMQQQLFPANYSCSNRDDWKASACLWRNSIISSQMFTSEKRCPLSRLTWDMELKERGTDKEHARMVHLSCFVVHFFVFDMMSTITALDNVIRFSSVKRQRWMSQRRTIQKVIHLPSLCLLLWIRLLAQPRGRTPFSQVKINTFLSVSWTKIISSKMT